MPVCRRLSFAAVLAAAVVFLCAPAASAAMKMKFKAVSHVSKVQLMHVQDDEKHVIGIYEHQGVALFEKGGDGAFLDRGGFDMYVPAGTHLGYARITFKDGSFFDFRYQGEEYRKPGEDLPYIKGTARFMKGGGRYQGIKGTLTYDGGYLTAYDPKKGTAGDSVVSYQATYTLGK